MLMSEDETVRVMEPPIYEDPLAARGDVLLRMCLNAPSITDPDARAILLRGAERMIASMPIAKNDAASIVGRVGGKSL